MAAAKSFDAVLERKPGRLGWTIVRIPFDVAKVWGARGQLRVKGDSNGFEFRTSLFPDGKGGHALLVNKKMQRGAGVVAGTKAHFRLEPDTAERVVQVPAELSKVLGQSKRLQKYYESFNYSMRRWMADQVAAGKANATRARKAEQIAELFLETMEGERELPPMIERALAQNPEARRGWDQMTPAMRRGQLMGIFYYRNIQSRARRLAKAVEAAAEYAEKRSGHL
ncbi:MAG: YdeI/OmpD-associated family protein [Acidobacteriia bacterium]|nr:YdeI/OmpD-associated family protein [Terriglobia bacterium]